MYSMSGFASTKGRFSLKKCELLPDPPTMGANNAISGLLRPPSTLGERERERRDEGIDQTKRLFGIAVWGDLPQSFGFRLCEWGSNLSPSLSFSLSSLSSFSSLSFSLYSPPSPSYILLSPRDLLIHCCVCKDEDESCIHSSTSIAAFRQQWARSLLCDVGGGGGSRDGGIFCWVVWQSPTIYEISSTIPPRGCFSYSFCVCVPSISSRPPRPP